MTKTPFDPLANTARLNPIAYKCGLAIEEWVYACGGEPAKLIEATEAGIHTRHHEAIIEHESHRARGPQPDIFTLELGSVWVHYTLEPHPVVRGYGWDPVDEHDSGGFLSWEFSWTKQPSA